MVDYSVLAIRVTGGIHRGRQIGSPRGGPGIRPTTDRVKLAIFSILGTEAVQGKKVLDLFACTGALGIEAKVGERKVRISSKRHKGTAF